MAHGLGLGFGVRHGPLGQDRMLGPKSVVSLWAFGRVALGRTLEVGTLARRRIACSSGLRGRSEILVDQLVETTDRASGQEMLTTYDISD